MSQKSGPARIYGVSISWIVLYGALVGVTSLVPIFPYVGGGGYQPLATPLAAIAPLLLGLGGGIVAGFLGGLIGMFIAPAAFPLGIVDVLLTATFPAAFVGLTVNNNRYWKVFAPIVALAVVLFNIFPYYYPGPAAGFANPPQPLFAALVAYYWLPWVIILFSPVGIKKIPEWARSAEPRKRYVGVFLAMLIGYMIWIGPWFYPYWYVFAYPIALTISVLIGYTWWVPALAVISATISIPIVEGLKRSGLPKVPGAIW